MTDQRSEAAVRTALYRFFDDQGRLLYVGITKDVKTRWTQHSRDKAELWWPQVAEKTVEWFDARLLAAGAEIAAIAAEKPLYNLSGTSSPMLVSESGAVTISTDDMKQFEWLTTTDLARRLVEEGIEKSMTRQRVMQLAGSDPAWPIPRDQWRFLANMWLWPWEVMAAYFRNRERNPRGKRKDLVARPVTKGHALLRQAWEHFGDAAFTRADLKALSGLSEAGIAQKTTSLEEQGLLRRDGVRKTSNRGKPHVLYTVVRLPDPA